jgi:hypothetical protein
MSCRKIGDWHRPATELFIDGHYYNRWSTRAICPSSSLIVGLKSKDETYGGSGNDDTALNDVMFFCKDTGDDL